MYKYIISIGVAMKKWTESYVLPPLPQACQRQVNVKRSDTCGIIPYNGMILKPLKLQNMLK